MREGAPQQEKFTSASIENARDVLDGMWADTKATQSVEGIEDVASMPYIIRDLKS